jgi:ubiquinone/menaquinone biosynthesis C-methylase UbiE
MSQDHMEFYAQDKSHAEDRSDVSGWERWHDWQAGVMCGSGLPALALAERVGTAGKVVAIDESPRMLAATRRKAAAGLGNVETRETSAVAIGGPDATFDAVTCKDGLMFCPDIIAAVREMRRVLKPSGRYAFLVWAEPEANRASRPCSVRWAR